MMRLMPVPHHALRTAHAMRPLIFALLALTGCGGGMDDVVPAPVAACAPGCGDPTGSGDYTECWGAGAREFTATGCLQRGCWTETDRCGAMERCLYRCTPYAGVK
jgi:hypothetical protein